MSAKLSTELVVMVADAVAAGIPGRLLKIRSDIARDTLFDRVQIGDVSIADAADQDGAIGIIFKYLSVAQQGVALENLKIIADVAANRLSATPIKSDDFGHWAELLANLLPEERYFLAVLGDCTRRAKQNRPGPGFEAEGAADSEFSKTIVDDPNSPFEDYESCQGVGLGLIRTGCVKPLVLMSNGFRFVGTSKLLRLMEIADLHSEALKKND